MAKKKRLPTIELHPLVRSAMRAAFIEALNTKSMVIKTRDGSFGCFVIDGIGHDEDEAIDKILGKYSWWEEG